MTREEAIKWLGYHKQGEEGKAVEALDMAIKALEQEPTTKNDLGVDWDELKRKIFMEVDGGTDDRWLRYADVCDNISNSIDDFKAALPSVTPQEPILDKIRAEIEQLPTSKCTETRRIYIDTDDFKENVLGIIDKYKADRSVEDGNVD